MKEDSTQRGVDALLYIENIFYRERAQRNRDYEEGYNTTGGRDSFVCCCQRTHSIEIMKKHTPQRKAEILFRVIVTEHIL